MNDEDEVILSSFTYNGIHSSAFGCYYVPDEEKVFGEAYAEYSVYDDEPDWRDGGIYYGNRVSKREFELDCYFEDINQETREKMMRWLDRRTSGWLVFDERPFVRYEVRPTEKVSGKMYCHEGRYSGTFTVTFTCYDAFGELTKTALTDASDPEHMSDYCGVIPESDMPEAPGVDSRDFLIYNCGTEIANTVISIGGTCGDDGLTITNAANGTACEIIALPPSPAYLTLDSKTGAVRLIDGLT